MKKFKEFLLSEDLGIGPEGSNRNPSLKDYIKSIEKEKKDLNKQFDSLNQDTGEKERIKDLLLTKNQELSNIRLFNSQQKSKNITQTPDLDYDKAVNNEPVSLKQSALEKLARPDTSTPSVSLGSEQQTSLSSGYKMSETLYGSNPELSNLKSETIGKTSKSLKF